MRIIQKIAVLAITLLWVVIIPLNIRAESPGPANTVGRFNTALLKAMKGGGTLGFTGRYELLAPVIKENFALPFMGEKSVGRYWETWGQEQQKLFLDKYATWSISSYANNFKSYGGEKFEILPHGGQKGRTQTIVSRLTKKNGETVDFYYRLREIENKWRIVDIQIKGVSQLALTRAQFVDILKNKGFDNLIDTLREKIHALSTDQ